MSFLLGATLFAGAVIFYVLQPILTGRKAPMGRDDDEMTDAEARRRVTLLALRDVEYDRETGKLDDGDYRALRRELSAEALDALEAEERERRSSGAGVGVLEGGEGGGADGSGSFDLDAEIRRVRQGLRSGRTCRECGNVNPAGSRFCSGCGSALHAAASTGEGAPG